jgi:Mn-dependent DtxR family transcriptional regulator
MMRKRAEWMTRLDDEILEYLEDAGGGTPKLIADELGKNNDYVGQRCRKLTSADFLERPSHGFYTLTERGESYLSGEFDASKVDV